MHSDHFAAENTAQPTTGPGVMLRNAKSIKYSVDGARYARQGAMIAFRGDLKFVRLRTLLRRSQRIGWVPLGGSGEAVRLRGRGEGFFLVRPSESEPEQKAAN